MAGKIKVIQKDGTVRDFKPTDVKGGVERGSENRGETQRIMRLEENIRRASILQVRRFFYGPTCTPSIRNQSLHFSSFGTYVQLDKIKRWEENVRTRD